MKLDYSKEGNLELDMVDYVDNTVNDFPEEFSMSNYHWNKSLVKVDPSMRKVVEKSELFHTFVAKALF
jgi:hypothetical protein